MKNNFLIEEIQNEIKIQKGLKMIEFMSTYNIKKGQYRFLMPLNPFNKVSNPKIQIPNQKESNKKHSNIKQLVEDSNQYADLLAEINQNLYSHNQKSSQIKNLQMNALQNHLIHVQKDRFEQNEIDNIFDINENQSDKQSSEIIFQNDDSLEKQIYFHDLRSVKTPKAKQEILTIKEEDISDLISSKSDKSSNIAAKRTKTQKIKKPEKSIVQSRHSKSKAADVQTSKNKSIIQASNIIKSLSNQKKFDNLSKSSLLDKSISNIDLQSEGLNCNQRVEQTQFQILKKLSESLNEEEQLFFLMKLENCQLQEQFLINRIKNRLSKELNSQKIVKNLTWQNLELPQPNMKFKKFNYAHLIQ